MEILIFVVLVALLIIFLINISDIKHQLNNLTREVNLLRESLAKMGTPEKPVQQTERPPLPKAPARNEPIAILHEEKKPVPQPKAAAYSETVQSSYEETVKAKMAAMQQEQTPVRTITQAVPTPAKQPTDFEKFIGENLISKIGIIILVLGVGFFVKYAIDQNWIGVYGRTAIGVLTGGVLVSIAHYLRKSFKTFSSLLTGGGFAVFYLTIAIAFHQYHIFDQTVAFVIMIVITLFSVLLSLAYDKKELAIFSQFGGYAAPFMVSTNDGNYVVLFTYMLILNTGILILAYFKRWHVLNLLAFIFTLILFSGWVASTFWGGTNIPYRNAMIFATAFYLVFFLVNILNNIKERKPFKAVEIMMILSNNLFYFIWGIAILYYYKDGAFKGLFTVLVGLFNFGWVVYLYHKKQVDKNLIYLLIALVMSYISLAIPIQLNGHSITLFWTAEVVILLWLSQLSGIRILKTGHVIIVLLALISLAMDWNNLYNYYSKAMPVIFNQAFITGICLIAGLTTTALLLRTEKTEEFIPHFLSLRAYRNVIHLMLFLISLVVPFLELVYQMPRYYPSESFRLVVASIYVYAYLLVVLWITKRPVWNKVFKFIYVLSWIALFLYLIVFHTGVLKMRYALVFGQHLSEGNFIFHYLAIPIVLGMAFVMYRNRNVVFPEKGFLSDAFLWFVAFLTIFIASVELDNLFVLTAHASNIRYYEVLAVSHKVGYPILWGVFAFTLISLGIKFKAKIFRIQALSLFALILLKLFLFDVWDMSEGGRIAAFVFLGVVLLVVSFLYQKLKNFLTDPKESENE